MKAQDYYREYQQKTLEMGFSPIGRQRFTGIIKTISTLESTVDHIKEKQASGVNSENEKCTLQNVVKVERTRCSKCKKPKWRPSDKGLHKNVLCKCSETPVICPNCKVDLTAFLDGRPFCEKCLKIYRAKL